MKAKCLFVGALLCVISTYSTAIPGTSVYAGGHASAVVQPVQQNSADVKLQATSQRVPEEHMAYSKQETEPLVTDEAILVIASMLLVLLIAGSCMVSVALY